MEDDARSQTLRAILGLRGMIIDGELNPGSRVSETVVIERVGVSRTPARMALVQVKEEGLLEQLPSGGFVVASFTEGDLFDAIEIRGTLEGMAARFAAERGVAASLLEQMRRCLSDLDGVVNVPGDGLDLDGYVRLNDSFHDLLVQSAGSTMVARSLERIKTLPFAAPNAFIKSAGSDQPGVKRILIVAQEQHWTILDAIRDRQGARAQALAVEHAFSAAKYLRLVLTSAETVDRVPGLQLIKGRRLG